MPYIISWDVVPVQFSIRRVIHIVVAAVIHSPSLLCSISGGEHTSVYLSGLLDTGVQAFTFLAVIQRAAVEIFTCGPLSWCSWSCPRFIPRKGMWVGGRAWEHSALQDDARLLSKAVLATYALARDVVRHPIDLASSELGITRCLNFCPLNRCKLVSHQGHHLHFLDYL